MGLFGRTSVEDPRYEGYCAGDDDGDVERHSQVVQGGGGGRRKEEGEMGMGMGTR